MTGPLSRPPARSRGAAPALAGVVILTVAALTTAAALAVPGARVSAAGCDQPAWAEGTTYQPGDEVSYLGGTYEAVVAHTAYPGAGWTPDSTPSLWDDRGACGGGSPTPSPTPTSSPTSTPTPTSPAPSPTGGPGGPDGFVVSEPLFTQMFPDRNPFYTYDGLTAAAAAFPGFAQTGDTTVRRQEAAAFLANVAHETVGLVFVVEQNEANYPHYCDPSRPYGCPAGQAAYYGRGPIQLSWNFNYHAAGRALGLDLLHDPFLVERDPAVAWQTALWYWMTRSGPGTMPAHEAIVGGHGFGETIRSINGALECDGGNPAQVRSRIRHYQRFTDLLGVPTGGNLSC